MFKKRLVKLRIDKGLSQYDLANALGLSRGQISNYELGTRHPDYETLAKIAAYFEVSTDYLLGHDADHQHINDDEALGNCFNVPRNGPLSAHLVPTCCPPFY